MNTANTVNTVYRCFVVYNTEEQQNIYMLSRGAGDSYTQSFPDVIKYINQDALYLTTKSDFYVQSKAKSEWFGLYDGTTRCYFLMMCFPASQKKEVLATLAKLMQCILTVPNYNLMNQNKIAERKEQDISQIIDTCEQEYITRYGVEGQPSGYVSSIPGGQQFQDYQQQQYQSGIVSKNPSQFKQSNQNLNLNPPNSSSNNKLQQQQFIDFLQQSSLMPPMEQSMPLEQIQPKEVNNQQPSSQSTVDRNLTIGICMISVIATVIALDLLLF